MKPGEIVFLSLPTTHIHSQKILDSLRATQSSIAGSVPEVMVYIMGWRNCSDAYEAGIEVDLVWRSYGSLNRPFQYNKERTGRCNMKACCDLSNLFCASFFFGYVVHIQ